MPTKFNVYFNGTLLYSITDIAALTKINTTLTTGYIVPFNQSSITVSGLVGIESINPIYTQIYTSSIVPISTISNINWIPQSTTLDASASNIYQIQFGSLGEPSCSLVTLKSGYNTTTVIGLVGSSSSTCASLYPAYASSLNTLYLGDYATMTSGSVLTFNTTAMNKIGNNQLVLNVTNAQNSVVATTNMTFVYSSQIGLCNLPQVDILNKSVVFYQPVVYTRADMIVISSSTVLNCTSGLANNKQW